MVILVASGSAAVAADLPGTSGPIAPQRSEVPTFAQTQAAESTPVASPWAGLNFGTEVFAIAPRGQKGIVGGGVTLGYDRKLDNHVVVGVQGATGTAPALFGNRAGNTFDYASASAKVGYELGRVTPFVSSSVVFAKPTSLPGQAYVNAANSTNDLFNSAKDVKTSASVGTGVDIAVTDSLKVGVSGSVGGGRAGLLPSGF